MQALQDAQQRFNDLVSNDWPERVPLEAMPEYDPRYMKEGFLQKKGQRLKGWKRRWFVCDGRTLSYYISRKDRRPNAVIPLEGCTVQDGGLSETWNSPRIYLTDPATGIMYCLSAEEGIVVTQWLDVLQVAVARVNNATTELSATEASQNKGRQHRSQAAPSSSDDEDGRLHLKRATSLGPSQTRTVALKSASSAAISSAPTVSNDDTKRTTRITSAPSAINNSLRTPAPSLHAHHHRAHRSKTQHLPTTISLENELSHGLDVLEALLCSNNATNSSSARHHVTFRPIGAVNGVLRSLGTDSNSGKEYARASIVLPISSEVAAILLSDHARRAEWDMHFPYSAHVATFDDATDLIYLSSGSFSQIQCTKPFVAPHVVAAACALCAAIFSSSSTWESTISAMVYAAAIGAIMCSVDYSALTTPRDLLLLRHVRESAVPESQEMSEDKSEAEMGQSVVLILEKSVVNELKPVISGSVRAHVGLSGWLLQPVDSGRGTLATYVTDLDMKGWVGPRTRQHYLLSRLDCVSVLSEYVNQAQLCGSELGFGGDIDEDEEGAFDTRSNGIEDNSDGSGLGGIADDESSAIFHPKSYMRGMIPLPSGGLKLIDKEIAKKQGGVVKDVIKSAGAKILEGKSAVSLSLPVRIFEPRTNLERVCDLMLYAPTFLNAAFTQDDALERFKYVITFAVAGLHHSIGQLKPFNPILGETFQAELNDGTDVSCEHTSHHPPISNFQFTGEKYSIAGFVLWHASMSVKSNAMLNTNKGPVRVTFPDSESLPGTTIEYNLPYLQIGGLLWGDRTVDIMGNMMFEDKKNQLQCELRLNPDAKSGMGGMFSSSKTPTDSLRGVIMDTSVSPAREICDVSGSWLHDLVFGYTTYWSINKHHSGFMVPYPEDRILASDSRHREDLHYLAVGDLDESQEWKVKLEVLQRADRKARLDGRRPNHWSFRSSASGH
ncbi:oxysterol binding family protein [Plasmopara halstedii]|uniref:Oxysterol binding family protein n=1 Tax=Plasmopara halstedii TaxID=4781 RepID=A0A0P1AGA0_PLAHL|nr:oxysterol binding family protein [Plasmopara halstedii]CEG39485.1 oxysterol binding family protein [Plasmopara halstedii]|eukprot:XP_024575854.1 oxysterol binding family protein [Plasmopara halstedii]